MEEIVKNLGENSESFKESYAKLSPKELKTLAIRKSEVLKDFGIPKEFVMEELSSCTNRVQMENKCRSIILAQLG